MEKKKEVGEGGRKRGRKVDGIYIVFIAVKRLEKHIHVHIGRVRWFTTITVRTPSRVHLRSPKVVSTAWFFIHIHSTQIYLSIYGCVFLSIFPCPIRFNRQHKRWIAVVICGHLFFFFFFLPLLLLLSFLPFFCCLLLYFSYSVTGLLIFFLHLKKTNIKGQGGRLGGLREIAENRESRDGDTKINK